MWLVLKNHEQNQEPFPISMIGVHGVFLCQEMITENRDMETE